MEGKVIVCASGYFSVLHVGHIEYLEKAKLLGDKLVVIVNSDEQAKLKTGFSFMPQDERAKIISALKCVDKVVISIDTDRTVCATLEMIKPNIFAKGGDQNRNTIPEAKVCDKYNIKIVDGLGDKIQSTRWLLKEVKSKLDSSSKYLNDEPKK
jgi:D-beta-D-heptose 7-phosphate kinase/D-beta-D-heptose 1-phosphate adenosyltransferase